MLEIQNVLLTNKNIANKKYKKNQIFLYDTKRKIGDYLLQLEHRMLGDYEDLPHFIITKTGEILQIADEQTRLKVFGNRNDKHIIKIAIENLGWLSKNTITEYYQNWIGDIDRCEPYHKKWRGYFFWDKYTQEQMNNLVLLCKDLCEKNNIPFITPVSKICANRLECNDSIICKSNYEIYFTDINPSFDFDAFKL